MYFVNIKYYEMRLANLIVRYKQEQAWWTIKEIFKRIVHWLLFTLFLPITLVGHFAGFRRLPVLTSRIGHLASEIDCFLKFVELGEIPIRGKKYFVIAIASKTANQCLIEYWKPFICVVSNRWLGIVLEFMTYGPFMKFMISDFVLAIDSAAKYGKANALWGKREPILKITEDHLNQGMKILEEIGIPPGAWFVCVHARESGYSLSDQKVHDYRNADISSMILAMKQVIKRGGWCIRVGDPSMKSLPKITGVVDYAHMPQRSPEMDVFLAARCRFFLGTSSGLFLLSTAFGVPSALTNMVPFLTKGFLSSDLAIPKLLRHKVTKKQLPACEIMSSKISFFRNSQLYKEASLELVDNSPEEIADLVNEMMDRLEKSSNDSYKDILFEKEIDKMMKPTHYSYGSPAKIASTFLRRHRSNLLSTGIFASCLM